MSRLSSIMNKARRTNLKKKLRAALKLALKHHKDPKRWAFYHRQIKKINGELVKAERV